MILITRPESDALILKKKFDELSIRSLIDPSIEILYYSDLENKIKNYDYNSVIITSKNALIATSNIIDKNIPINIVGENSANLARSSGFVNISNVGKDVKELIQKLKSYSKFLYLRGDVITLDIKHELPDFFISELICYEIRQSSKLSDETIELIQNNSITSILFFSKQTAIHFLKLIKKENLDIYIKNIKAIAISDSVANILEYSKWNEIIISPYPSEHEMIELVKELKYGREESCK